MMRPSARKLDRRLPPAYRGRRGYRRLLESVLLRVSVSGIRGKSGLTRDAAHALWGRGISVYAKVTGTDPVSWKDGRQLPIVRDPRRKAILDETLREVKLHWPMDAIVLENQAITPYTMRVFNEVYCRPNYLLLTNIRRDHQGDIARQLPLMARAFARSAPEGSVIISGERDAALKETLRQHTRTAGARFIDASPAVRDVPGLESVTILDALLCSATGQGLAPHEARRRRAALEANFRWRPSAWRDVAWFHGAEINDVDSTWAVLEHLQRKRRLPVTFVAYFRPDRVDRTASFVPFFERAFAAGHARAVYVAGSRSAVVERRLRGHGPVHRVRPDVGQAVALARRLGTTCRGQAVMTVANAVPPWPRALAEALSGPAPVDAEVAPPAPSAWGNPLRATLRRRVVEGVVA